jgi:hypothetical protein
MVTYCYESFNQYLGPKWNYERVMEISHKNLVLVFNIDITIKLHILEARLTHEFVTDDTRRTINAKLGTSIFHSIKRI